MKTTNKIAAMILALLMGSTTVVPAQAQSDPKKTSERVTTTTNQDKSKKNTQKPTPTPRSGDRLEPDDATRPAPDVPQETQANRLEQISEEAAIVSYYNNFFSTYRVGPEDVISVEVFNQPRYSRGGIVVPPSGRISLQLIPGGLFVNGKTVEEISELIKKKYDEYIIDPQVTVSLEKASSYRYSVIGDVGAPGIKLMNHRMTVTEALSEAGGVLRTGDKSKVVVYRRQASGMLSPIAVNVSAIYKGKAPDNTYLVPGDQIIVPGNKFKTLQTIMGLLPLMAFGRIFTGGFPY